MRSSDDGRTWNVVREGNDWGSHSAISDISFGSPAFGVAVSLLGEIITTTDGGVTWIASPLEASYRNRVVHFPNENFGIIAGLPQLLPDVIPGLRMRTTTNGGRSWDTITFRDEDPVRSIYAVGSIRMFDSLHGMMLAYDEVGRDFVSRIFRTEDGGKSWDRFALDSIDSGVVTDLEAFDSRHGMIVGLYGAIHRTEDGGKTWQRIESGIPDGLGGLAMSDSLNAIALRGGAAFRTTDGGLTWQEEKFPDLRLGEYYATVALSRSGTAVAVTGGEIHGRILRSTPIPSGVAESVSSNQDNSLSVSTDSDSRQVTVEFVLADGAHVQTSIFNILGREVMRTDLGSCEEGTHRRSFEVAFLPSGSYHVAVTTPERIFTGSFVIAR